MAEPPRLVKADELDVDVYWQAPNLSRQVILGWRDGTFLPTDINYHRDHLGIVTNNFGDMIRIGDGDEVRDVAHPLSPPGLIAYDYALTDSMTIQSAVGRVMVYQIQVRPRSFAQPLVIGTLYLDVASAELVRFRFSFTPAAYLDRQLEDISVVLENALYENRFWLPHRQEIEIRRRATWLDFPARGIIRGRWEIRDYQLNRGLPDELLGRPSIGGLMRPARDGRWSQPLDRAIADVAQPVNRQDMETLRGEIERIAGSRVLSGLPTTRVATGSLSDVARVNRVQGLTLGFGGTFGLQGSRLQLRPTIAYGTSDNRLLGSALLTWHTGGTEWSIGAARQVKDFSDLPVVAPLVNSLAAQEAGRDYGDYVLLHSAGLGVRQRLGGRTSIAGRSRRRGVATRSVPAPRRPTASTGPTLRWGRGPAGFCGSGWSGRAEASRFTAISRAGSCSRRERETANTCGARSRGAGSQDSGEASCSPGSIWESALTGFPPTAASCWEAEELWWASPSAPTEGVPQPWPRWNGASMSPCRRCPWVPSRQPGGA